MYKDHPNTTRSPIEKANITEGLWKSVWRLFPWKRVFEKYLLQVLYKHTKLYTV